MGSVYNGWLLIYVNMFFCFFFFWGGHVWNKLGESEFIDL